MTNDPPLTLDSALGKEPNTPPDEEPKIPETPRIAEKPETVLYVLNKKARMIAAILVCVVIGAAIAATYMNISVDKYMQGKVCVSNSQDFKLTIYQYNGTEEVNFNSTTKNWTRVDGDRYKNLSIDVLPVCNSINGTCNVNYTGLNSIKN